MSSLWLADNTTSNITTNVEVLTSLLEYRQLGLRMIKMEGLLDRAEESPVCPSQGAGRATPDFGRTFFTLVLSFCPPDRIIPGRMQDPNLDQRGICQIGGVILCISFLC